MEISNYQGIIERYRKYLPVSSKTPVVSLLEGNTPLILAKNISSIFGKNFRIYLKFEGLNPTGSFKDRGMTMAVSKAKEQGQVAVICASTGNTSASAAAYAARAGMSCVVLIPEGNIALGKLAQALIHNAKVISVKGNFDVALDLVREISEKYPVCLVNSINPYRIQGQKTASFEICDSLNTAPDFHSLPVGNAGNITAYWMGYKEYKENKKISFLPRMLGFQAKGACPIVKGKVFKNPETIATAIRIGNPASWDKANQAKQESAGLIEAVTDPQILTAYRMLAKEEGVFVEPASAASVAGLLKLKSSGYFDKKELKLKSKKTINIVCTLTGHGLKDPNIAIKSVKAPKPVKPDIDKILRISGVKK